MSEYTSFGMGTFLRAASYCALAIVVMYRVAQFTQSNFFSLSLITNSINSVKNFTLPTDVFVCSRSSRFASSETELNPKNIEL